VLGLQSVSNLINGLVNDNKDTKIEVKIFGSRPYITLNLCMPLGFLHCSPFFIIHFNLSEDCSQLQTNAKFNIFINILELPELLYNSKEKKRA